MYCFVVLALLIIIYCLTQEPVRSPRTKYLFMTGGYDSVFRLCQLVITDNMPVQPIYLNIPDTDGFRVRRRNINFEIQSMRKVIKELSQMGYGHMIYPLQIVTSCALSSKVRDAGNKFYKAGTFNRPVTQYIYMAEVSLQMNKVIETGVLCSDGGAIYKTVGDIIDPKDKMININKTRNEMELIFRNLKFPLCGISKKQMLEIAKRDGYEHILHLTISCWYPNKNGKPCRKCTMCKERII